MRTVSILGTAVLMIGAAPGYGSFLDQVSVSEWAGSGANTAYVVVNFSDGAEYAFGVRFDGTANSLQIHQLLDQQTGLDVAFQDWGWGVFIDGFSYAGHSDQGYTGGENWWHYWVSDDAQTWTSPFYGITDRVVANGSWDGWVYGRASEPIPEPVSLALLGLGGLAFLGRRTRRATC